MKHSLTALLLTLALFCCLLTGCGPTPDVPGGSEVRYCRKFSEKCWK